jgi:hypothetical protein
MPFAAGSFNGECGVLNVAGVERPYFAITASRVCQYSALMLWFIPYITTGLLLSLLQ